MDFSTILGNISVIIASLVALYGIRSWQVELRGRRKMEIAEETLVAFYEVKDVFVAIRSVASFASEGKSREPQENESDSQRRARDQAQIVFERVMNHQEQFNRLISIRYRFLAYFDSEKAVPFDELLKTKSEILLAARMLADMWSRPGEFLNEKSLEKMQENIEEKERIIWCCKIDDPLNIRIAKAVDEMKATCQAAIKPGVGLPENFWLSFIKGTWWY